MNKSYRSIWNESLGAWVAASETAKARGKKSSSRRVAAAVLSLLSVAMAPGAFANTLITAQTCVTGSSGTVGRTNPGTTSNHPGDGSGTYSVIAGCQSSGNLQTAATVYGAFSQVTGTGGTAIGFLGLAGKWGSALGLEANATGTAATALGFGSNATNRNAVAIGGAGGDGTTPLTVANSTTASGKGAIAVGSNDVRGAQALADDSIALGGQSTVAATATSGIAVGRGATVNGANGIAQGDGATVLSTNGTAIGTNASIGASSANSVAIGTAAAVAANSGSSVAIGDAAKANTGSTVAIGSSSTASGSSDVALGRATLASGGQSVAAGDNSRATGGASVAMGSSARASGSNGIAIGVNTVASAPSTIAIGMGAAAAGTNSIALGSQFTGTGSTGTEAIAIGMNAGRNVSNSNNIAVGGFTGNTVSGIRNVAMGTNTGNNVTASYTVAIGDSAQVAGNSAIAIGSGAQANGTRSISIGTRNVVSGNNSGALGDPSYVTGAGTYTIGNDNGTLANPIAADNAGAFGNSNLMSAAADNSRIVGNGNNTSSANTMIVGNNVTIGTGLDGAVVLGNNSTVSAAVDTPSTAINGTTYNFVGGAPADGDVVSVGSATAPRQIQNVAAGRISSTSTDAINGSQLYGTNQAMTALDGRVDTLGASTAINLGGSSAYDPVTGAVSAPSYTVNGATYNNVGSALAASTTHYYSVNDGGTKGGNYNNNGATGLRALAAGVDATARGPDAISIGSGAEANTSGSISIGRLAGQGASGSFNLAVGELAGQNVSGASNTAMGFGAGNTVAGDFNTATGTDAGSRTTGSYNTASGFLAGVLTNGDGNAAFGMFAGAATTGDSNVAIGTFAGTDPAMTTGVTASNSVSIGTKAYANADDAVALGNLSNVSQVRGVALGAGAVAGAQAGDVALGSGSVTASVVGTASTDINGTTYKFVGTTPSSTVSVGAVDAERTITNVAAGRISGTSTDAINGSQLYGTNQAVTALDGRVDTLGASTATNLGGSSVYDPVTGAVSAPSYTVNGATYNNVGSALAASTTHYYSVNDGGTKSGNYNNDGATSVNSLAAGVDALADAVGGTAVGAASRASGGNSTAIGSANTAAGLSATAIGNTNTVSAWAATAVGSANTAAGERSVALGHSNNALGQSSVAVGAGSFAAGDFSAAIGSFGSASGTSSVAVGNFANAGKDDAVAVGRNAVAGAQAGDVALGSGSTTATVVATATGTINGATYSYEGAAPTSTVSVGDVGAERTITNVAAGRISATSTDAINGSQLYGTNQAMTALDGRVDTLGASTATNLGGSSVYDPVTGAVSAPSYTVNGSTYNNVGSAITAAGGGWNMSADGGTTSENIGPSETANFAAGSNATVSRSGNTVTYGVVANPTFAGMITANGGLTVGAGQAVNMGKNVITNVATGNADTDAANVGQLNAAVAGATASGLNFTGNDATAGNVHRNLGQTLAINGGATTTGSYSGSNLKTVTDPTTGAIKLQMADAPVFSGTVKANGFDANGNTITNVAAGSAATDAVNYSQLQAAQAAATTHYYSVNDGGVSGGNYSNDGATGLNAVAGGVEAQATGTGAVALGWSSDAISDRAVAIGAFSRARDGAAVALGSGTTASGLGTIAIGSNVEVDDGSIRDVVGIGRNIEIEGDSFDVVAMGRNIGGEALSRGIAIGSDISLQDGIANFIAMGAEAKVAVNGGIAIGAKATAGAQTGDVALGTGSITASVVGTANAIINGTTYKFAGTTPTSTVSVGGVGAERTITNVAAGRIGDTSTDAINGSQLYATNQAIGTLGGTPMTFTGNTGTVDRKLGETLQIAGEATTTGAYSGSNLKTEVVGNEVQIKMADAPVFASLSTTGGATIGGNLSVAGTTTTNNLAVTGTTTLSGPANISGPTTFSGPATFRNSLTASPGTTIDMGGNVIANVGGGQVTATSTDAINGGQLYAANQAIGSLGNTPMTFTGNTGAVDRKLGETLQITGAAGTAGSYSGANLKTEVVGNEVQIKMADAPVFASLSTTGGATIGGDLNVAGTTLTNNLTATGTTTLSGPTNISGPTTLSGGTTISSSLTVERNTTVNMGNNVLTNVATGTANSDAANVGQVNTAVAGATASGLNFTGNDATAGNVHRNLGQTLAINGGATTLGSYSGANLKTVTDPTTGAINLQMADAPVFSSLSTTGGASIGGDLSVAGTAITNNLTATGATTLNTLAVSGRTTLNGGLTVGAGQTVNMGGNTITNVGNALNGTDAVNLNQLNQVGTVAGKGWNMQANGGEADNIAPGDTVNVVNGSNTTVEYDPATNRLKVGVVDAPTFSSVTTNDLTVNNNATIGGSLNVMGPTVLSGGATISGGLTLTANTTVNMGGNVITNVGAGANPGDAVNRGQLNATNQNVANLGGRVNDIEGSVSAMQGDITTIRGDVSALDGRVANVENTVNTINNGGGIRYFRHNVGDASMPDATADGKASVAVGSGARTTAAATQGVAMGINAEVAAANGTALGSNTSVRVEGGVALGEGSVASTAAGIKGYVPGSATTEQARAIEATTSTSGAVSVGDAANGQFRQITGVAAGTQDSDAVNVAQLQGVASAASNRWSTGNTAHYVAPQASGSESLATGSGASASGANSMASGNEAIASGANAIAVGNGAVSSGLSAAALGQGATVSASNSVALGAGSVAVRGPQTGYAAAGLSVPQNSAGEVSVGSEGSERQLTNVAAGSAGTDAVNVNQLNGAMANVNKAFNAVNQRIDNVEKDANAGSAGAMAMASMPQASIPGKSMMSAGVASYQGQTAIAIGVSQLSDNGRWVVKFNGSANSRGKVGVAVGAGFHW